MENFSKRETKTTFEFKGRTFEINSYDPMTGNYILFQIMTSVLPMGLGDAISSSIEGSERLMKKKNEAKMMSKEEFIELQKDILLNVYEVKDGGHRAPVVRENGTYGIEDVSMSLFMNLIVASVTFNFKDFFEDAPSLSSLIRG